MLLIIIPFSIYSGRIHFWVIVREIRPLAALYPPLYRKVLCRAAISSFALGGCLGAVCTLPVEKGFTLVEKAVLLARWQSDLSDWGKGFTVQWKSSLTSLLESGLIF